MTNEEKKRMDYLDRAEKTKRMEYLERVEKAARMACTVFVESDDYDAWDKAMDRLEAVLKEKP